MRVMAIDTSEAHVGMPDGHFCMTLVAKRNRPGDRLMLTRLLVAPRNLIHHDAVFRKMAFVALDRIGCLRMDTIFPNRSDFILPRLHLW